MKSAKVSSSQSIFHLKISRELPVNSNV